MILVITVLHTEHILAQGLTCSDAIVISAVPFSYEGTSCGFGDDYNSSNINSNNLCNNSLQLNYFKDEDIVFTYTPAISGVYDMLLLPQPANVNTAYHIFEGCPSSSSSNCVYFKYNSSSMANCQNFLLKKDHTYYIIVDSKDITNNCFDFNFTLNLATNTLNANDFCQNALPLQGNATNYHATDCQEPDAWTPNDNNYDCVGGNWFGNQNGVWFTFNNPVNQTVNLEIFDIVCSNSNMGNETLQMGVWSNTGTCDLSEETFFNCMVTDNDAVFTMPNLPAGNYYLYCDGNQNANCTWHFASEDIEVLDSCSNIVGTMSLTPISNCRENCITANYNGSNDNISDGSALQFILHTSSIDSIVGEILRSDTPQFCFDPSTMTLGTTYYISAVIGKTNNDEVDLLDSCTVIAKGTPVSWYQLNSYNLANASNQIDCNNPSATLSINPLDAGNSYNWSTQNGDIISGQNTSTLTIGSGGTYNVTVSTSAGCSMTLTQTITDHLNDFDASIEFTMDSIINCIIQSVEMNAIITGNNNSPNYAWIHNGTTISTSNSIFVEDEGWYILSILDANTGCIKYDSINVVKDIYPPIAINDIAELNCKNDSILLLGSSPVNGVIFTWSNIINQDTIPFIINDSAYVHDSGMYLLSGLNPNNGCTTSLQVEVSKNVVHPYISAGADVVLDCTNGTAYLLGDIIDSLSTYDVSWSSNGNIVSQSHAYNTTQPDSYIFEVKDVDNGCISTDTLVVFPIDSLKVTFEETPYQCYSIYKALNVNIIRGTPPYTLTLNGNLVEGNGSTYLIDSLTTGNYNFEIESFDGCVLDSVVNISVPRIPTLYIGEDVTIDERDELTINVNTNVVNSNLEHITWTPTSLFINEELTKSQTINLEESTNIIVILEDIYGCKVSDTMYVTVKKINYEVFVPGAFSPNGDNINDKFNIFGSTDFRNIDKLSIFDRWGNLVYEGTDLTPNSISDGWDGTFNGKKMDSGVFVYVANLTFRGNHKLTKSGDITLLRN